MIFVLQSPPWTTTYTSGSTIPGGGRSSSIASYLLCLLLCFQRRPPTCPLIRSCPERGSGTGGIADDKVLLQELYYWGRQNRGGTVCRLYVGSVWPNSFPPRSFLHTKPCLHPLPLDGTVLTLTNLETFVLVDAWLLFYSKKVNFMSDLRRKYFFRLAVALV